MERKDQNTKNDSFWGVFSGSSFVIMQKYLFVRRTIFPHEDKNIIKDTNNVQEYLRWSFALPLANTNLKRIALLLYSIHNKV